jgi:hypothetical protein
MRNLNRAWQSWIISDRIAMSKSCPLYPQKQTFGGTIEMSALCHKQTSDPPITTPITISASLARISQFTCQGIIRHLHQGI